jgi:hypothetical protein
LKSKTTNKAEFIVIFLHHFFSVTPKMSFGNLGKSEVCFGEYKCSSCRKQWQSCRAWADFGQKCKRCSIDIKAYHLEKLFKYICKNCQSMWDWKFVEEGLRYQNCNSPTLIKSLDENKPEDLDYIRAHRLKRLENADTSMINPSKEHRSDLCQKCQALGRCCFGNGTFSLARTAQSGTSTWSCPNITPDVFPTPKKTISSDSESD